MAAAAQVAPIEPIEVTLREFHAWLCADDAKGWARVGRCFGQIAADVARELARDEADARARGIAGMVSSLDIRPTYDSHLLLIEFLTETQRLTDEQLTLSLYWAICLTHKTRHAMVLALVAGGARANTRVADNLAGTSKDAFHGYLMHLADALRRGQLMMLSVRRELELMNALLESGGTFDENDEKWGGPNLHRYEAYAGEWPRLLSFIHYGGYGLISTMALLECGFDVTDDLNAVTPDGRNAAHIICSVTWFQTHQIRSSEEWATTVNRALQAFARRGGDLQMRDNAGRTPLDVLAARGLADGPEMTKLRALLA